MSIVDVEENLNIELLNHFKGERDGYVQVGDKKWFLPVKYRKLANEYKHFEVRKDDIWVMGYPRSGTTLTEEIIWLLTHDLDFEGNKKPRARIYENSLVQNEKTVKEILEKFPEEADMIKFKLEALKNLEKDKTRRVIKTHLPFELLPEDIVKKGCKIVYVCRHPKDVCVSHYHLQKSLKHIRFCGELDKYLEYFRNGNCMFGPYFEHVKQGFERIGTKNFIFIFFEEFKKDSRAYVKKLSEFLEIPMSEEDLNKMKEHLDFENFRKNMHHFKDMENKPIDFVRKGKVGGWREYFTDEMNRETDEWIEKNVKEIGIKYPIE